MLGKISNCNRLVIYFSVFFLLKIETPQKKTLKQVYYFILDGEKLDLYLNLVFFFFFNLKIKKFVWLAKRRGGGGVES